MNQFDSKGGGQSIAQGDHSIGQQNNSGCVKQTIIGNGNVVAGTGDVRIEHLHQHYPRTAQGIPLQRPPKAEHFTGRDTELKELLDALQPGRAVTLCGPGGMGKTALAAQAVWTLAPGKEAPALFPDGIIFHSFYGQEDVSLAFAHIVRSYDEEQQDTSFAAAFRLMASKQALLILDGAEEAGDLPAVLRLRGACGVLITSRKKEDAPDELLELKPLDEQPAKDVFLLYSRDTACRVPTAADTTTVQAICKLLGGWPVALRIAGRYCSTTGESAAAYLRFLRQQPFKRLGKGEHGQENAALLLRRSVAQVSDDARLALGLAGCLAFAPLAREPVAAILDGDELRSADALGELVNYGLLERKAERWQTSHALIHTYAREELALSTESLERLAEWYMVFCYTASEEGVKGYVRLDAERAHCLRLMESCLASKLWQEVKLLVGAISDYLDRQGWWTERLAALEMGLDAAKQAGDHKDEGWHLNSLGYTYWKRGEYEKALEWFDQSLSINYKIGNRKGVSATLTGIDEIYRRQSTCGQALQRYVKSLSIQRKFGDREGEGVTLNNIGLLYWEQGDYDQALSCYDQCLTIAQELGCKILEGTTLNNIAVIYRAQSSPAKALKYHEQDLAICQQLGDRAREAESRWNIGLTYEDIGDFAAAEEHISLAVQLAEKIDHPSVETWRKTLTRLRAARRG